MKILIKCYLIILATVLLLQARAQVTIAPPDATISVTATEQYQSSYATGFMQIYYGLGRTSINDDALRRPLIIIEGIDPGHIIKPEEKFGVNQVQDFLQDVRNDDQIIGGTLVSTPLHQLLEGSTRQYDIIYLDYAKGPDYIQRNALLVEQVIRYVNSKKVAVGGVIQPNVVLGISMGGLCARYALKDMENKGQNHQTRLFISWDAPHLGANVPEGYQRLARHARDMYIGTGGTALVAETLVPAFANGLSPWQALNLANTPAAMQMLINRVGDFNTIDNTTHDSWQLELKNMGYPQGVSGIPFRRVAVSNGSECAKPQAFNAGDNLLTYKGNLGSSSWLGEIAASMVLPIFGAMTTQPLVAGLGILPGRNQFNVDFAVNAKAATGTANQIYKGKITYQKKVLWLIPITVVLTNRAINANANTLPYDYYPGGFYDLAANGLNLQSNTGPNDWASYFIKYNITASNQRTYNFIPTPSALDIGSGNVALSQADYLTPYRGSSPPAGIKATPFGNFITAFNGSPDNEVHTLIERRNGDWTANELTGTLPNVAGSCEIVCGNASISGPDVTCGSGQYTVPGFPAPGVTVAWQSSNNAIATPNGSGLLTQGAGSGAITLTATITPCNRSLVVTKPVFVGTPDPSKFVIYND